MQNEGQNQSVNQSVYIQLLGGGEQVYIPDRCTFRNGGSQTCGLTKHEHKTITTHTYEEVHEGRFNIRNFTEKQRRYTLFFIIFLIFVFTGSSVFLIYDHVKYPGQTETPRDIVVLRNICFITMFITTILLCGGSGYYIYLNYTYEVDIKSTIFVIVWITTYLASVIFWAVYHVYFTVGKRHPGHSVHITKMIAMWYVIITTVIMMLFACAQDPTMCMVLCLLEN